MQRYAIVNGAVELLVGLFGLFGASLFTFVDGYSAPTFFWMKMYAAAGVFVGLYSFISAWFMNEGGVRKVYALSMIVFHLLIAAVLIYGLMTGVLKLPGAIGGHVGFAIGFVLLGLEK
ncbi:MAG: hypothetical protein AAFV80_16315 [Bacteroidota bacterium]